MLHPSGSQIVIFCRGVKEDPFTSLAARGCPSCAPPRSVAPRRYWKDQRQETLSARWAHCLICCLTILWFKTFWSGPKDSLFNVCTFNTGMFLLGFWDRGALHHRQSKTLWKGKKLFIWFAVLNLHLSLKNLGGLCCNWSLWREGLHGVGVHHEDPERPLWLWTQVGSLVNRRGYHR